MDLSHALVVTTVALGLMGFAAPAPARAEVSPAELQQIRAAVPDAAYAKPAQERRVLIYDACKGYVHDSIPYGNAMLRALAEQTGAFTVEVADTPDAFKAENLQKYDAIVFNNTTGELFTDDALKRSLLDFVRNGGGIVGMHAATDCFYDWPEFGVIMGGYFAGHPWNEEVTVRIDDAGSPLTQMFDGQSFKVADEIYQFRAPYSRDQLHLLLSLDTNGTDMTKGGINRTDGDFAVSWVRNYGLGRIFYCSLGHRHDIFWTPALVRHYLAGIQFALGDLPACAVPSAHIGKDGWIDLIGSDLTGWIAKPDGWTVKDGELTRAGKNSGDIWTEQTYGDFVLDVDYRISEHGNSGVFFRTGSLKDPVQTGLEIQVLDSAGKTAPDKHDAGALYDAVAPTANPAKPAGEWNHLQITARGSQIKVVMNGTEIVNADLDQWTTSHRNPDGSENKFGTPLKDFPRVGHIGLQDHGDAVSYRNLRIKPL